MKKFVYEIWSTLFVCIWTPTAKVKFDLDAYFETFISALIIGFIGFGFGGLSHIFKKWYDKKNK